MSDRRLADVEALLCAAHAAMVGDPTRAAQLAQQVLSVVPGHPGAILLLATALRLLDQEHAARDIVMPLAKAQPGVAEIQFVTGTVLAQAGDAAAAVEAFTRAAELSPAHRRLSAAALKRIGEVERTIALYDALFADEPGTPGDWIDYGDALKAMGCSDKSAAAFRRAIELKPDTGEAYACLADLKTIRFAEAEIASIRKHLDNPSLSARERVHFHFALGKALEDGGADEEAFAQYRRANALGRNAEHYNASDTTRTVERARALFTEAFFAAREGWGRAGEGPIFIVGLPRAGSTLVEQILAAHSRVEATTELMTVENFARRLGFGAPQGQGAPVYPDVLANLPKDAFVALGRQVLNRANVHRKRGTPFFIDKLPNNWLHTGFIHLMLPDARIIDVRRHPMACGFSNFKQNFVDGQFFSRNLTDLGHYYRDYVTLMEHFAGALPGRIHRVIYEDLVADPETEIRKLLTHCGLGFEETCLSFHEGKGPVRTASALQVRRPISNKGLDHWRRFEPWLGPLKVALGAVLDAYPRVP